MFLFLIFFIFISNENNIFGNCERCTDYEIRFCNATVNFENIEIEKCLQKIPKNQLKSSDWFAQIGGFPFFIIEKKIIIYFLFLC